MPWAGRASPTKSKSKKGRAKMDAQGRYSATDAETIKAQASQTAAEVKDRVADLGRRAENKLDQGRLRAADTVDTTAAILLAKAEVQEQAAKVARSGVPLIVGLLLGLYALGFLLLAMVHALSLVVDAWLAALIVGFGVGVVSLILINIGRNRLKGVKVVPEKTIGTVKENVQLARNQIRYSVIFTRSATRSARIITNLR